MIKPDICGFITIIIFQISIIFLFRKLTLLKPQVKIKHIFIIFAIGFIQILLNLYDIKIISAFFSIIYFCVLFKSIFTTKKKIYVNYSIIIWILCLLLDVFIMTIVSTMGLMDFYQTNLRLAKALGSLFLSISVMIISYIKPFINILNKTCQ